jgi:Polysaccharide lyase
VSPDSTTGGSATPAGCGTGFYFCWSGDTLSAKNGGSSGYWRVSEPNPLNSCFSQQSEATPAGSKVVSFKLDPVCSAETGWGWKTALNGYRVTDGNVEPNSHAANGNTVWYRVMIRFPAGRYFAGPGNDISHLAWHSNSSGGMPTGSWNTFMGVRGDSGGSNPRLVLVRRAGQMSCSSPYTPAVNTYQDVFAPGSLQYGHWYNIVFMIRWAPDNTGQIDWYVDGALKYSNHATPTLLKACSGYVDQPDFDLQNYRGKDVVTTTYVDWALAAAGPTQASVGG